MIRHASEPDTSCRKVLCVDLDGSLIATDLLYESFVGLMRTRPWDCLRVPGWLSAGRAHLKRQLAERSPLDVKALPYRDEVIAYLRSRRAEGCRLVLATAAEHQLAAAVAEHLGLFDEVIASDGVSNLKGVAKLRALEARFGKGRFEYLGNGWEDIPIWQSAESAAVVYPSPSLLASVRAQSRPVHVFQRSRGRLKSWLRLLRIHQWAKNVLLFVPLITAHRTSELRLIFACLLAFIAFSLSASSIYILNDLFDLPSDRFHHRKRNRLLAAGEISIPEGLLASFALAVTSWTIAWFVNSQFLLVLIGYVCVSSLYSFGLKRRLLLDVFCLAGLYTLRIFAGGAATEIPISPWLMAFSMFLFLSLAFVKRYTELAASEMRGDEYLKGRGYKMVDLDLIRSVGPASGYLAALVICLYINDHASVAHYRHPQLLWLMCPLILYWITRIWFVAQRGKMHSDPVVFALSDRNSLLVGLVCGTIYLFAAHF